jgi:excisionase family DNA binding protein
MREKHIKAQDGACFKVPEAARVARVGTQAIYKGVQEGKIPHIRFGRNIVIPKSAFLRWLDNCGEWITTHP